MIIPSLLDTDLYKFTMMQVVQHHFAEAQVEYRFKCRNRGRRPDAVRRGDRGRDPRAVRRCASRSDELDYLRHWRFFKSDFVDLLGPVPARPALHHGHAARRLAARDRHHDQGPVAAHDPVRGAGARDRVRGVLPEHGGGARPRGGPPPARTRRSRRRTPCREADFRIADYGTRRRFSRDWQDEVIRTLKRDMAAHFVGTSNV